MISHRGPVHDMYMTCSDRYDVTHPTEVLPQLDWAHTCVLTSTLRFVYYLNGRDSYPQLSGYLASISDVTEGHT